MSVLRGRNLDLFLFLHTPHLHLTFPVIPLFNSISFSCCSCCCCSFIQNGLASVDWIAFRGGEGGGRATPLLALLLIQLLPMSMGKGAFHSAK